MSLSRREFMKRLALLTGTTLLGSSTDSYAQNTANELNWEIWEKRKKEPLTEDYYGVLVDTTYCIGCRRCEWACNEWNKNPNQPISDFEQSVSAGTSVFDEVRRMHADSFTVVNRYTNAGTGKPIYVKRQCMHCLEPGCLSACFVDAFRKTREGAVLYNPGVCVGCRYCMIACPFDVPAFEYYEPLTPQITKCTFCFDRISKEGAVPACVSVCPSEVMRFGKRSDLIKLAHERIENKPDTYIDHIYGEHEAGGTSWLYLSAVPFEEIGFRTDLKKTPIPKLSKGYLFTTKMLEIVAAWPLVFAAFYAFSKFRRRSKDSHDGKSRAGGKETDGKK